MHNVGSKPPAQHTDNPMIQISLQIIMIINHIDNWWIHVPCATKGPVNGHQSRIKPLSFIDIWIPFPAKCSSLICLGYVSKWSLNCLKWTHWRYYLQKAVPTHQQHELSYCQSIHHIVITCLTYLNKATMPWILCVHLPNCPVLKWHKPRFSKMIITHAE